MSQTNSSRNSHDRATLEAIKSKVNLVDLVSEVVELKGAGDEMKALCPFHDDQKASLSVNRNKNVFCCHGCGAKGNILNWVMLSEQVDFKTALEKLAALAGVELAASTARCATRAGKSAKKEVTAYPYVDEAGRLLYEVVRYEPKSFKQRRPVPNGKPIWKLDDVRRVLFRLPELLVAIQAGEEIWITEGEKDALALVEAGVCATTAAQGASAPWLDDYTKTLLNAQTVSIVADNDNKGYERAKTVRDALDAAGVPVRVVKAKEGKDAFDHLAAGHSISDFIEIPSDELDALVGQPDESESVDDELHVPGIVRAIKGGYAASSAGLFRFERDKEGDWSAVELTNADIEIIESRVTLLGLKEKKVAYRVAVRWHGREEIVDDLDDILINRMREILSRSGIGEATIKPKKLELAQDAMHELSTSITNSRVYGYFGWHAVGGKELFLHGTGGMGPSGPEPGVVVDTDFSGYGFPQPAVGEHLVNSVAASLDAWQVSRYVMTALLGAVWRSVLPELPPCSMHLAGTSGMGKTTLAQLALAHFGAEAGMTGWSSTANSIELMLWIAANHVILIDEFVANSEQKRYELEDTAERIQRAAANHTGRRRMNRDGTLQEAKPPRAFVLSTGEVVPGENSVSQRARALLVELDPKDAPVGETADPARMAALTRCQSLAEDGVLAAGLAAYVVDIAKWIDAVGIGEVRSAVRDAERKLVPRWTGKTAHARTAPAVASLAVGWELWLEWAQRSEVLAPEQAQQVLARVLEDLDALVLAQAEHIKIADPADRWVSLMISELRSGRCHVTPRNPDVLILGEEWGWRDGLPQGDHIGWMDERGVYLIPSAAHSVIVQAARRAGNGWSWGETTTWRFLFEQGWLINPNPKRFTHQVRIRGMQERVIHVGCELLVHLAPATSQVSPQRHQTVTI